MHVKTEHKGYIAKIYQNISSFTSYPQNVSLIKVNIGAGIEVNQIQESTVVILYIR